MDAPAAHTLPKVQRLSGRTAVSKLMSLGRWGSVGPLRYCFLYPGGGTSNRVMVSVPKKNFKRAVKRNLLKRRMREAYRLHKDMLTAEGVDFLIFYASTEVLPYEDIRTHVEAVLTDISARCAKTGQA